MKTSMVGSGMRLAMGAALAVAAMGTAACERSEKVGETSTTAATSMPAATTPASVTASDDSLAGADSARDAGHIAPVSAPARPAAAATPKKTSVEMGAANDGTAAGRVHDRTPRPPVQPNSVDNAVGPGHITTPALPDDHRATGAPNSDGSHNIGTAH